LLGYPVTAAFGTQGFLKGHTGRALFTELAQPA